MISRNAEQKPKSSVMYVLPFSEFENLYVVYQLRNLLIDSTKKWSGQMYIRPDHLEKWSGHGRTGRIGRAAPWKQACIILLHNNAAVDFVIITAKLLSDVRAGFQCGRKCEKIYPIGTAQSQAQLIQCNAQTVQTFSSAMGEVLPWSEVYRNSWNNSKINLDFNRMHADLPNLPSVAAGEKITLASGASAIWKFYEPNMKKN